MAVHFHEAVLDADCLFLTSAVVLDAPLTIACWFKASGDPSEGRSIVKVGYIADRGGFGLHIAGQNGGRKITAFETFAHLSASAVSTGSYDPNTWHLGVAVFTSTTLRQVYLDAVAGPPGTGSMPTQAPFIMDRTAIAWDPFAGGPPTSFGFPGCLRQAAIWNIALNQSQIDSLFAGAVPSDISSGALKLDARLVDQATATANLVGPALTLHDTATGINDCFPDPPALIETGEGDDACEGEDVADAEPSIAVTWDPCVLVPQDILVEMMVQTVSPGRSIAGREQVVQPDAGCWQITLDSIKVWSKAELLKWREYESNLNGRNGVALIPLYEAKLSDIPIAATLGATAAIGVTRITINQSAGEPIRAGLHFSVGDWAYRLVSGSGTAWRVWPPFRAAVTSGTALNFNTPRVRCRLARDDGMDITLEHLKFAQASVVFVEDV